MVSRLVTTSAGSGANAASGIGSSQGTSGRRAASGALPSVEGLPIPAGSTRRSRLSAAVRHTRVAIR